MPLPGSLTKEAHTTEAKAGGTAPGIAIFIFGRRGYAAAAEHLALTLRQYSPSLPVHLWAAEGMPVDHSLFHKVHKLDPKWYEDGPGSLKVNIYDILPKGEWLYLDADTLCIADLAPFVQRMAAHDFGMEVHGKGKEADPIPYTPWATNTTIRKVNDLGPDAIYYGVQSSWMWIRKPSDTAAQVFKAAKAARYKREDLKEPWGHDIPDELRFATALTVTAVDPYSERVLFYGNSKEFKGLADVAKVHPLVCLYGDNRQHRLIRSTWFDAYDRFLRNAYAKASRTMFYSLHRVMGDKYINYK
jgi:hypothetical protein